MKTINYIKKGLFVALFLSISLSVAQQATVDTKAEDIQQSLLSAAKAVVESMQALAKTVGSEKPEGKSYGPVLFFTPPSPESMKASSPYLKKIIEQGSPQQGPLQDKLIDIADSIAKRRGAAALIYKTNEVRYVSPAYDITQAVFDEFNAAYQ